jgi:tetratricopeptide (TPR) repeat protein
MTYPDQPAPAAQPQSDAPKRFHRHGRWRLTALLLLCVCALSAFAQQPPQNPPPQNPPPGDRHLPLSQRERVTLGDLNIDVVADKRVIVMMAALNVAGYDYEPGNRPLSALRQQLREDLKHVSPALARKLRDHFVAHRQGRTDAASVAPYLSLALSLAEPPAFSIETALDKLPEDVREIADFALLLEEFYRETQFSRLLPKYTQAHLAAAESVVPATAQAVTAVISYLHTEPILELPPLYVPRPSPQRGGRQPAVPLERLPMRERRFVVMPDLLNAAGAANLRVVRDTYYLLLGPTAEPNVESVRRAFLHFVVDPLAERQVKEVAAISSELKQLLEARGDKTDPDYASSAYYLISDSFVRATDARMSVLGLAARRKIEEADAIYELSLAYERGAVLVFHFYHQVSAFEPAGINLRDYFASLLKVDFEREEKRLDEYGQRLARYKQARLEVLSAPPPSATISNADEQIVARIIEADEFIQARKYADARAILEAIRRERPTNARALFGLAEVSSKQASAITDADRLEEELFAAVELYKMAAQHASPETEKWLAQRSYVAAGKILDFLEHHDDALAAYELAIKLGEVNGGAYQEAVKAKQQREQKPKP